jgi:hypothetical protein
MSIVFTANERTVPRDGRTPPGLTAIRSGIVNVLCPRLFRHANSAGH